MTLINSRWVHRDDEELFEMRSERRPGRPPSTKEDLLKQRIDREIEEFKTGFYIPDLQNSENIERLRRWDGTVGSLAQVKFTRIPKEDASRKIN